VSVALDDAEVDRLAAELTAVTGEELADAVRTALAERLARERARRGELSPRAQAMLEIARHCAALPDLDPRTPDEIIGYDENGMW
jgi:antitoxin VapB